MNYKIFTNEQNRKNQFKMLYQYIRNDITTGHLECNIKRSVFRFNIKPTIPHRINHWVFVHVLVIFFQLFFGREKIFYLICMDTYFLFIANTVALNFIYSYLKYLVISKWRQNLGFLASCYSKYCKDMQKVLFKYKRKYIHLKMIKKTKKRKMCYLPLNIILWIT